MLHFQVTTAGSLDKDCELGFFTEIWFDPPKCNGCENGCGNEQPTPGNSFIEFDINKHTTDLLGLYRYLASKVYAKTTNIATNPEMVMQLNQVIEPTPPGAMGNLLNYFGQDHTQMDPQAVEQSLGMGGQTPLLGFNEKV